MERIRTIPGVEYVDLDPIGESLDDALLDEHLTGDEEQRLSVLNDEERRIQRDSNAILAWCNVFLSQRGMEATDLSHDFSDGVRLINLLEVAFDCRLDAYNARPKLSFHQLDNLAIAFRFLKAQYVRPVCINDINEGVVKSTVSDRH